MKLVSSFPVPSILGVSLVAAIPSFAEAQATNTAETGQIASNSPKNTILFINLTNNDPWRAGMAISFAQGSLKQGHPVTIFLNVTGVHLASKTIPQHTNGITGKSLQQMLQDFMAEGGTVITCPTCMKQAGITEAELIEGVQLGSPEVTGLKLFADDVRVMSW